MLSDNNLIQEAQLPQRHSASAAHMQGCGDARPSSPVPLLPLWLHLCMVESETRNKRTSSVPSTNSTLRWIGHSRSSLLVPAEIQNGVLS